MLELYLDGWTILHTFSENYWCSFHRKTLVYLRYLEDTSWDETAVCHMSWDVCTHTSENLRGAVLPPLLLPASGSHNREGWFGACALVSSSQKYSEGRGAEGVRQLDRKTDPDRWERGTEPPSNFAAAVCFFLLLLLTFKPHYAHWSSCSPNQKDAQILTLRIPMVLPVAGIFGFFGGAVGAFFLLLLSFLLDISETCDRWEATGLHGEDADSPGCQHAQSDQSPQRQLPFFAAGPLDHQRRLAGLSEVPKNFPAHRQHRSVSVSASKMFGGSFIHYARSHVVWIAIGWASTFLPHSVVQCSTLLNDFQRAWQRPNLSDNSIT